MTDTIEKIAGEMRREIGNYDLPEQLEKILISCADRLLALRGEAVAWLASGARFKLSPCKHGAMFIGFPAELGGKWVALADATDNRHMALSHPSPPISDAVREAVARCNSIYDADRNIRQAFNIYKADWQTIRAFLREQGLP